MKYLKLFENYKKESMIESSESYNFIKSVLEKCEMENSFIFLFENPVKVGENVNGDVLCNRIDLNEYDRKLSFWFLYDKEDCELNGCRYENNVVWLENGEWNVSELAKDNLIIGGNISNDFLDIIANSIKDIPNIDAWCNEINSMRKQLRSFRRNAVLSNDANKKSSKKQTWEERLELKRLMAKEERLLNGSSHPYELKELDRMIKDGEKETDRFNKELSDIAKEVMDEISSEEE